MKLIIFTFAILFISWTGAFRGRIVGGYDAEIEDFPYQVSLQGNGMHFCGGSIYKPNVIITAAHCVSGRKESELKIRAGSNNRENGGVLVSVKKIIIAENWNSQTIDSDFALLILEENLQFSDKIQPIEIAVSEPKPRKTALVSGWGLQKEGGLESPILLQALETSIWERNDCKSIFRDILTENMMCAGVKEAGKSPCQMDSGGPLVVDGKLVGVVSWGIGCGRANSPSVFTNVPKFQNWIESKLY